MKYLISILLVCFSFLSAEISYNQPESVVYDNARSCYYISNKGNGEILKLDDNEILTIFCKYDTSVRGLHILGDYLYAAGDGGVSKINLSNGNLVKKYTFPGMSFLNDVDSNEKDSVFVSDMSSGKIYGIKTQTDAVFTLIKNIVEPNGLLFDKKNHRLLVCSWSGKWIKSIDLKNLNITTLTTTNFSSLDGLTADKSGNVYVSSWSANAVYMYKDFTSVPIVVQSGFKSPADIFCNKELNILTVPNFDGNIVNFIDLKSVKLIQESKNK